LGSNQNLHIRRPNDKGKVSQFEGNKYVVAGSRSDPGVSGLINPSMKIIKTTKELLIYASFHATIEQHSKTYC